MPYYIFGNIGTIAKGRGNNFLLNFVKGKLAVPKGMTLIFFAVCEFVILLKRLP